MISCCWPEQITLHFQSNRMWHKKSTLMSAEYSIPPWAASSAEHEQCECRRHWPTFIVFHKLKAGRGEEGWQWAKKTDLRGGWWELSGGPHELVSIRNASRMFLACTLLQACIYSSIQDPTHNSLEFMNVTIKVI